MVDSQVDAIAHDALLSYPLCCKGDFLQAMAQRSTVRFRGTTYDAARYGDLLPEFFFPVIDPDDFVAKVTDLIVARGLAPYPLERGSVQPPHVRISSDPPSSRIQEVLSRIELALLAPLRNGFLPVSRVDALDIVMHALEFNQLPDGLNLWRDALWYQRLDPAAREAIVVMADYMTAAAYRGEWAAITAICDCLDELVEPAVLATRHIGGTARSHT